MTTFTKLAKGESATLSVHTDRKLSKINDNIYVHLILPTLNHLA